MQKWQQGKEKVFLAQDAVLIIDELLCIDFLCLIKIYIIVNAN